MIFRQLFEPISSTYTYLIACEESGQAILVDPVLPAWQRDLEMLNSLGLRLAVTLDTHIHADHITAASRLKLETGSAIAHPAVDALTCVDRPVREGEPLQFGSVRLDPLYTPGHTDGPFAARAPKHPDPRASVAVRTMCDTVQRPPLHAIDLVYGQGGPTWARAAAIRGPGSGGRRSAP
jgi:hypothetical protein